MSRPERTQESLADRVKAYPVPEGLFHAERETPETLAHFGVPPRPSAHVLPQLRPAWERVFGQPLRLLPFVFDHSLQDRIDSRLLPRRLEATLPALTRFEPSSNWSGAYTLAHGGRGFVQVWGQWRAPDKLKVPAPPLAGTPGKDHEVAAWIGLDGQRRYFDASLPQMGTTSILRPDGTERAKVWVQWWARDELGLKYATMPMPMKPGDSVACIITTLKPQLVSCTAVNLSTTPPTMQSLMFIPPLASLPGGGAARPSIAGATAEWVVERSRNVNGDQLENFPDYGQTRFDFCHAVLGEAPDLASVLGGTVTGLEGARDIRMFDRLDGPARTQFISMPKKLDNTTLQLRYGGFR